MDSGSFRGGLPETPEDLLEKTETPAAGIISEMTSTHLEPNGRNRDILAIFLANLDVRGPSGRGQMEGVVRAALQEVLVALLESPNAFRQLSSQRDTDEESSEHERLRLLESAKRGEDLTLSQDNYVALMLAAGSRLSPVVAGLGWLLIIAGADSEFILSDTPVAHWDPAAAGYSAAAWRSSPRAETTIPLDSRHCLCVGASFPSWSVQEVGHDSVEEVNLRSYEWANKWIYASSQKTLQEVRLVAKRNPHRLADMKRSGSLVVSDRDYPTRGSTTRLHPIDYRPRESRDRRS